MSDDQWAGCIYGHGSVVFQSGNLQHIKIETGYQNLSYYKTGNAYCI